MKHSVFVALSTFADTGQEPLRLLQESGLRFVLNPHGRRLTGPEVVQLGKDAEGIVAGVEPYDRAVIDQLPRLRCISRCGVGTDNIDLEVALKRGIEIRNTPCVVIQPVAEFTLALMFDLLKNISYNSSMLKSGRWEKKAGRLLSDKTIGILGLGRIGCRVAEMLRRWDVKVCGSDVSPDRIWAAQQGVALVSVEELLRLSDVLCIHLSMLKDHPFRLGDAEISSMKAGAYVVNVSRGQVVDESALYRALKSGRLGGAALDVFAEEPYTGPLAELENVVLTPHMATLTQESRVQMEMEAIQNIIDFFASPRS